MPTIISVAEVVPPFEVKQEQASDFARELFSHSFKDIDRLLKAFQNGQIEKRYFAKNIDWFKQERTFEEKNNAYVQTAVELGKTAIQNCLTSSEFLKKISLVKK